MTSRTHRGGALVLAALIATTPGCLGWAVNEATVPGSERQGEIREWQELRARPWARLQSGRLPIRLETYGTRQDERARQVTRKVEFDVYSVTAAVVSGALASGTFDGYLTILIATPFTLVTDLLLVLFTAPTLPFTAPAEPPAGPEQIVERGELEQALEPVPLGTRLTLSWGELGETQALVMPGDGMLYLSFAAQARQALTQGLSSVRLRIVPEEPAGLDAQVTLPLALLVEAAATEIETGDPAGWDAILEACPAEATEVRAAVSARAEPSD